jgi:peroxidase
MGTSFASCIALLALLCLLLPCHGKGKLSTKFYAKSCPGVATIVRSAMAQAVAKEPRMGASIIRLFFHDCFVNVGHIYHPIVIGI